MAARRDGEVQSQRELARRADNTQNGLVFHALDGAAEGLPPQDRALLGWKMTTFPRDRRAMSPVGAGGLARFVPHPSPTSCPGLLH